jgi:hypothetical protein
MRVPARPDREDPSEVLTSSTNGTHKGLDGLDQRKPQRVSTGSTNGTQLGLDGSTNGSPLCSRRGPALAGSSGNVHRRQRDRIRDETRTQSADN